MSLSMFIGTALAMILSMAIHVLKKDKAVWFWRTGLVVAALVYVGFALWSQESIGIDLLGVVLYTAFAWLSIKYGLIWLAIGWALHIGWDVIVHLDSSHVPEWYPALCFGFDAAIALYIIYLVRLRNQEQLAVPTQQPNFS